MVEIISSISIHLGLILGLIALILLTFGTILILINESKYVKIHGILAGMSWVLTLINIISLVSLPLNMWNSYNSGVHWAHIILGGIGLVTSFFSMLFGIAAERKPAKTTGYITLVCWWGAFFLGFLLV